MLGVDPLREGHDHVHQHLVAVGDDEGAGHAVCLSVPSMRCAAAASASGLIPSAAAQATRSGSCAVRKPSTAPSVVLCPTDARRPPGGSPVCPTHPPARGSP